MIKAVLTSSKNKKSLHTRMGYDDEPVLVTTTHADYAGTFKSASRTVAGTTTIVTVNGLDAIVLTDIIISSEKTGGGLVTVQFTDGVNTVIIVAANVNDAPCNLAIPFMGNWCGWQGAYLDLVTVGNEDVTVSVGYFKVRADKALPYASWNALR
jgi:hypothetical protein